MFRPSSFEKYSDEFVSPFNRRIDVYLINLMKSEKYYTLCSKMSSREERDEL